MKSINTKRIAAVAAGAALLGIGLAFAGPVTFSNVQIIGSSGQPLVQIVVGSKAAITDGIAAANIAAAIGNLAYTTSGVTATVNTTNANNVLHVTVSNSGGATITNAKVWLNQSGTAFAAGSYSFTALIGSVLNHAVQLGAPSSTKSLTTNQNYAYQQSSLISPTSSQPSPYNSVYASAPYQSVARTSGGGVQFLTGFTLGGYDNILQVGNAQLPALLNNYGQYGETERLWITGFPVYNQQSGVTSFAIMSTGGAYQVVFNKPITVSTNGQSVNNAAFTFLGQNWTIIGYTVPGGVANKTIGGTITSVTSTLTTHGGQLIVASSLSPLTTVYVGQNVTGGKFTVQLTDIGQPNSNGVSPAAINLYYNGAKTNTTQISPGTTQQFNISGTKVYVKVNQTFAGLYAYQKYAKIQIYSNVFTLKDGNVYNQTYDPGWNVNLLWTNTSTGNAIQLQSIIAWNASPETLLPTHTFSFIQSPATWNLEFLGDNLGNNYDPLNFKTSSPGNTKYQNGVSSLSQTGVALAIYNVTEPVQFLTVTSGIGSAFTPSGGPSTNQVVYDLVPYVLTSTSWLYGNAGTTSGGFPTINLFDPGNFVQNAAGGITITIKGSSGTAGSLTPVSNTIVFTTGQGASNTVLMGTDFSNVTAIQLSAAYPGLVVTLSNALTAGAANTVTLAAQATPSVQYQLAGKGYISQASGATILYNQQNGQTPATFAISTVTLPTSPPAGATQYFTYSINEIAVPGNTAAVDMLQFGIYNATTGSTSSPLFWINASSGTAGGTPGTRNNMTYTPVVGTSTVNAQLGFRTERGSTVASMSSTSVTVNYATTIDMLQLAVSPSSSTASVANQRTYGPFAVGQAVSGIPGVLNVTVYRINASATLGPGATYTITGENNLTATPSVTTALTPVWLTNLTTTPLVVLDSQANPASSLILIGSGYVNSLSQQLQTSANITVTPSTQIVQAYGNKIYVAGYTAAQTTAAANNFIQELYAAAST